MSELYRRNVAKQRLNSHLSALSFSSFFKFSELQSYHWVSGGHCSNINLFPSVHYSSPMPQFSFCQPPACLCGMHFSSSLVQVLSFLIYLPSPPLWQTFFLKTSSVLHFYCHWVFDISKQSFLTYFFYSPDLFTKPIALSQHCCKKGNIWKKHRNINFLCCSQEWKISSLTFCSVM